MATNLPLTQSQLYLPNVHSIGSSERAFGEAFLIAAQILVRHLEQIQAAIGAIKDFKRESFNLTLLQLFSKMYLHYYSYVLLEIHHDRVGSQLLIEHLGDAAITLIYLLEEGDNRLASEYISASIHQAHYLLITIEEQLHKFSNHPDLLSLKVQLETVIAQQQEPVVQRLLTADSKAYLWGPQSANTTAKRGAVVGLNFLTNPARQIALRVVPASWLELQVSYLNSSAKSTQTQRSAEGSSGGYVEQAQAQPGINFTDLRDAAHLCLHATRTFLEEIVNYQGFNLQDIERQQQMLNVLFEWFHNTHSVYQLLYCHNNSRETQLSSISHRSNDSYGK